MNDDNALNLINGTFQRICAATNTDQLRQIPVDLGEQLAGNYHDEHAYPRIGFTISPEEIQTLINNELINNEDYSLSPNIQNINASPLTKLFYAIFWKNNHLSRSRSLIKGILSTHENIEENDFERNSIVFHQFGKHLRNPSGQPIIDQHVIRAYAVFTSQAADITTNRSKGELKRRDLGIVNQYINWLRSDALNVAVRENVDCLFLIDRILFVAGKSIKA